MGNLGKKAVTLVIAFMVAQLLLTNAPRLAAQQGGPLSYPSAIEAVSAFVSAVRAQNVQQLMQILGEDGKDIIKSGDPVADRQIRQLFLDKYDEMHRLVKEPNGVVTLYIGAENWPFPIPLIERNGQWRFDTETGKKEVLYRRIGRNEFDTIDTLNALVDAQREYASQPRDGNSAKQYAGKLLSDRGRENGLYWETTAGRSESPIGPLVAEAAEQGYRKGQGPTPFHGYIFRILKKQGASAPGGALDYMTDGKLTRGFALIAYPVVYRNSGVMTFIVNQNGKIYQKDLGPNTAAIASSVQAYSPDKTWKPVD